MNPRDIRVRGSPPDSDRGLRFRWLTARRAMEMPLRPNAVIWLFLHRPLPHLEFRTNHVRILSLAGRTSRTGPVRRAVRRNVPSTRRAPRGRLSWHVARNGERGGGLRERKRERGRREVWRTRNGGLGSQQATGIMEGQTTCRWHHSVKFTLYRRLHSKTFPAWMLNASALCSPDQIST